MRVWHFGKAKVTWPGKHGVKDYKVEIGAIAPTLGELVLVVGGMLTAEDRYDGYGQHGRLVYLDYLKAAAQTSDLDELVSLAEQARDSVNSRAVGIRGFIPCHKGGKNECVSLCKDCFSAGYRLQRETIEATLRWWGIAHSEDIERFVEKVSRSS